MKLTREMKAYIVLLHLLSQKWMNLRDMIKLFGWIGKVISEVMPKKQWGTSIIK